MAIARAVLLLVLTSLSLANQPAVRVRITQNGLDYAIKSAMETAERRLENLSLPDEIVYSALFKFSFTNMKVYNVDMNSSSLQPVPKAGMYISVKNINLNIKGIWKMSVGSWTFPSDAPFEIAVKGLNVNLLIDVDVIGNRLSVLNTTCAAKLAKVDIHLSGRNRFLYLYSLIESTISSYAKAEIPNIACKEGEKAIKKQLNKQFSKLPVKQTDQKKLVTLDYSVVKAPDYKRDAVDLFLKGEFQPSNGQNLWHHQPAPLPHDQSRDRMIYVTIMDHMINSASHAYYHQGAMRAQINVTKIPRLHPQLKLFHGAISKWIAVVKQLSCPDCDIVIQLSARLPPKISTNTSGIYVNVSALSKVTINLPKGVRRIINLDTDVSAMVIPTLNGRNLSTKISNLKINSRVKNLTLSTNLPSDLNRIKDTVKKQIETLVATGISGVKVPVPIFEKFSLKQPKISYGKGYMVLETDVVN